MGKKEKRQRKIQRQQEILNGARAAHRELSEAEQREFDTLQGEIEALGREIEEEERRAAGDEGQQGDPDDGSRAILNERSRISEIAQLCREFGMEEQMGGYISNGTSVEEVRGAVIEHLRKDGAPLNSGISVETDEQDKFRNAAADALLMRGGIEVKNAAEGAREMRGMSLRDLDRKSVV